jgi:hypothetical protein
MKKFIRTVKFPLIILTLLLLYGCTEVDSFNGIQLPTSGKAPTYSLQKPPAGYANVYILTRNKYWCTWGGCKFPNEDFLLIQDYAGQKNLETLNVRSLNTTDFICFSIKPGSYRFVIKSDLTSPESAVNYPFSIKAGKIYPYAKESIHDKESIAPVDTTFANAYVGTVIQQTQEELENTTYEFFLGKRSEKIGDVETCNFDNYKAVPIQKEYRTEECRKIKAMLKKYQSSCYVL